MSFRIEKKIAIDKDKIFFLKKFLYEKKFNEIFEKRMIYSLYLDTINFKMYYDSIEGIVPRKKIRFRSYNNFFNKDVLLEKKISSVEGRFKTSNKTNEFNKILKYGYFDNNYGVCYPKLFVRYERSYYKKNNIRITIDKKINFAKFNQDLRNTPFYSFGDYDCAEIKYNSLKEFEQLEMDIFLSIRNSKYCIGIDHILKNSDIYSDPIN